MSDDSVLLLREVVCAGIRDRLEESHNAARSRSAQTVLALAERAVEAQDGGRRE